VKPDDLPPIPSGLQALLRAAAQDPDLLERVVARRSAAAREAGFELTASESAILEATEAGQLRQMALASLPEGAPLEGQDRPDEREATTGIRPDHIEAATGIRPGDIPLPGGGRIPLWLMIIAGLLGLGAWLWLRG
jgi:hypothetical protein